MTAASEEGGTSESESLLQQHPHHSDGGAADRGRSRSHSIIEEYGSIAVAVVEQPDTHVPVVLHDLSGPMLLTEKTLQRQDSIISCIGRAHSVVELPREADILLLVQAGCGNDTSTNNDSGSGSGSTGGGQATIPSEIASMTKNLIGCGALSLCNGIARCANTPTAVFASSAWILLLGAIFGYFCWLIAKICHWTGRTTYRGCWQDTVGHSGSMLVSIINGLKATGANLAYATILADTTSTLLLSAGIQHDLPRNTCLLLVTGLFVLPLCLLKNLAVLAPFSLLGTFGIILTAVAMAVRYFDGSYAPGGQYHDHIDVSLRPSFGTTNNTWSLEILPFVCMVYEAYVMHYNAARFYTELKNKSLTRFGLAVSLSFFFAAVMYIAIATLGFLTFGEHSAGYILNNYSPYDPLATGSRLCVGLAVLMAYPIVFFGVRDSVMDIFEVSIVNQMTTTSHIHYYLTVLLLTLLTIAAVFITDLGLINAVGGGLVTTPIVFLFPTIMYRKSFKWMSVEDASKEKVEAVCATALTAAGVVLGLSGAYIAIKGALSPSS